MIPPTQPNIRGDNRAMDQVHPPQIQSGTRQLFLDDELVTSADNIRRVLHQPTKHAANPLLTPEHPWEGQMVLLYGTVLHDPAEDLFKMWYQAFGPETGNVVCYATSRDGLRWERAPLGVTEVLGSRDNNVVFGVANHPNYIEMHSVVQARAGVDGVSVAATIIATALESWTARIIATSRHCAAKDGICRHSMSRRLADHRVSGPCTSRRLRSCGTTTGRGGSWPW